MKKLISIIIILVMTAASQSPVITQTAQFNVGPAQAIDMKSWGDDFIVSKCRYENEPFACFNQLILVNQSGEVIWSKEFAPRTIGSRNNLLITASNLFCIFTLGDTIYKINRNGDLIKSVALVNPNYMEIASQPNMEVVVMEANVGATFSKFFIYNEDLDLVKTITGQPGATYNVVRFEDNYFVSGSRYGGGITTNRSGHVVRYDTVGNLLWLKEIPDVISMRLIINRERLYFCGVDVSTPYMHMLYGEISIESGDTLWTKTWGAPYPITYSTVLACRQIRPSLDGGFVVIGSTTVPGQQVGDYEPNMQSGLILGHSPNLNQPWIKTTSDLGDILAVDWKDSSLVVFGNLGSPRFSKIIIYSVSGLTAIEDDELGINSLSLGQNYPNPFNPSTKIKFSVHETGLVSLKVYNLLGKEVSVLVNKELLAGEHEVSFEASALASGMYIYTLSVGRHTETRKMVLVR
jgi:hypothetical protein